MKGLMYSSCRHTLQFAFDGLRIHGALSIAVICLMIIFQATDSSAAKSRELSMASLFPPESKPAKSLNRWAEKVNQETGGRISIRHFPANTLVAAPDMRSSLKVGVADIGCSFIYKPEPKFDPSIMLSQLILGLTYENCLKIFDDIWNRFPELWADQWKDYKLLWITPIDPNLMVTVKHPVRNLADLKKMQLRMPSPTTASMLKALGATPVSMSTADWIVSLDKGTTDGATISLGSLIDYKIGEKIDYVTNYSFGPGIMFLVMNKRTWNSLSPDIQEIVDVSAKWGRQDMIDEKKQTEKEAVDYLKSKGVEFIRLSPEEYAKWEKIVRPVFDKVAEDLNAKGFPGTQLIDFALERGKFYYSHTE